MRLVTDKWHDTFWSFGNSLYWFFGLGPEHLHFTSLKSSKLDMIAIWWLTIDRSSLVKFLVYTLKATVYFKFQRTHYFLISISISQLTVECLGLILGGCAIYNFTESLIESDIVLLFFYSTVFFVLYFWLPFNIDSSFAKPIPIFIWCNNGVPRELNTTISIKSLHDL